MVSAQAAPALLPVVTTFNPGDFPESLAADHQGNLYASLGFLGEIVKVTPGGQQRLLTPHLDVGDGLITGLAFDADGNLYVADATFQASPTPVGVFRIGTDGAATRVATSPASFPNGLAFHEGDLYVSDSSLGAIWRLAPGGEAAIWLHDPLLAPKLSIGANGIAFRQDSLYVAVADSGTIVRVPLGAGGTARHSGGPSPGEPAADRRRHRVRCPGQPIHHGQRQPAGAAGARWRAHPARRENDGLGYPTMPAFGMTPATRTTLYITNGALRNGTPDIVALDAGVRGLPLP